MASSRRRVLTCWGCGAIALLGSLMALAATAAERTRYAPYPDETFPRELLWGDTHLHSHLSLDANMRGNAQFSPADAYRFARGETVTAQNGMTVKLRRPLDFLVVSDHAEYIGVMEALARDDALLLENATARRWNDALDAGDYSPMAEFAQSLTDGRSVLVHDTFTRSVWANTIAIADAHNDPGTFTALIGYEWTSMPGGNNLHRVVVFRDGAERVGQVLPFSAFDSDDPEDLWAYLARYEAETGGGAFAIPHNSNLSGGLMFPDAAADGSPMSADYARARARFEPLVEATQVKGDSETHPFLSPDDEFADYETWDASNVGMVEPHKEKWFPHEYLRSALKIGLDVAASTGVNPYQFGLIGSTDSHTALATADEDNYWGKFVAAHPAPERWQEPIVPNRGTLPFIAYEWQMAASGYAGVWAGENTREAIFDAMRRRETYATTGPRIVLRFFGGWTFDAADAQTPDLARTGYARGVPMGGLLPARPAPDAAPTFLVSALRDPDGANLDRLQIVKGWRTDDGALHEQVYNVAASDERQVDADGRLPPLAARVDVETASYHNDQGASALATVWQDPDFNPDEPAFYYLRVIEIPTPRWTAYDAAAYGQELPEHVPMITRERAYSSPIWYQP